MRRLALSVLIFSAVALAGPSAQAPRDRNSSGQVPPTVRLVGTGRILGRAVAAETGAPLRNARVSIASPAAAAIPDVLTDQLGRFAFTALVAGRYTVSATRSGYLRTNLGARSLRDPSIRVDVVDGAAVEGIELRMLRGATISGRVVDDLGEAVVGITIAADWLMRVNGRDDFVTAATSQTDDQGEFRIFGLPAGRFVVRVDPGSVRAVGAVLNLSNQAAIDAEGATTWSRVYFPGVPGLAQAQTLTLTTGQDVAAINFTVSPVRQPRVSVAITDAQGFAATAAVGFGSEARNSFTTNVPPLPQGGPAATARVEQSMLLEPGDWVLFARGPQGVGIARTTLGSFDVTVPIRLVRGGRISGRIIVEGTPLPPRSTVEIEAAPVSAAIARAAATGAAAGVGRMQADGSFTITDLLDVRELRLRSAPAGRAIKDIIAGGRSLLDGPLEFKGGEDLRGVQVILTDQAAELSGTATDASKAPVLDYSVLLFPEDPVRGQNVRRWGRWVRPNQNGRFVVDNLMPGTYLAVAVDSVDDASWSNADYLDRFRGRASRVVIGEGQRTSIVLEVVKTP